MALFALTRCFLLLLLIGDWFGDPYHGQSPLSQSLSSQTYCCQSICPTGVTMDRLFRVIPLLLPLPLFELPLADVEWAIVESFRAPSPGGSCLYVFMSLQC